MDYDKYIKVLASCCKEVFEAMTATKVAKFTV
jgi:hypothetical protein